MAKEESESPLNWYTVSQAQVPTLLSSVVFKVPAACSEPWRTGHTYLDFGAHLPWAVLKSGRWGRTQSPKTVWWPAATGTALACSFHSLASLSNHVIGPDKWPGTPVLNKEHPREQAFYSFPKTGVLGISSQLPLPYHRTKRSKRPQMGHLFTSSPPFLRELWVFFPSDVRTNSFTKEENSHQRWPRHPPFDLSRQVRDLPLFLQLMETIHVHSANFSSSDLLPLISFRKLCKNKKKEGGGGFATEPWRDKKSGGVENAVITNTDHGSRAPDVKNTLSNFAYSLTSASGHRPVPSLLTLHRRKQKPGEVKWPLSKSQLWVWALCPLAVPIPVTLQPALFSQDSVKLTWIYLSLYTVISRTPVSPFPHTPTPHLGRDRGMVNNKPKTQPNNAESAGTFSAGTKKAHCIIQLPLRHQVLHNTVILKLTW